MYNLLTNVFLKDKNVKFSPESIESTTNIFGGAIKG